MKAMVIFKLCVVLPLLLFIDYLVMIFIGCTTNVFGINHDFYCGPYCIIGKIILGLSMIFIIYLFLPHIKELIMKSKNK